MEIIDRPRIILAAARTNARMTQKELAKELNVDLSTIVNWEKGKSEPSVSQLRKISELSRIPMDFIFIREES